MSNSNKNEDTSNYCLRATAMQKRVNDLYVGFNNSIHHDFPYASHRIAEKSKHPALLREIFNNESF